VGPGGKYRITGYIGTGSESATDPSTGVSLLCGFGTGSLGTGAQLTGSWTGVTNITVFRSRQGPSQRVSYDTTIASQEITLTLLDNGDFRLAVAGPFTDTLVAPTDTATPGYASGDWTCGPEHPLARVQEGVTLTGTWQVFPEIPFE
jgi:hypothetical protein